MPSQKLTTPAPGGRATITPPVRVGATRKSQDAQPDVLTDARRTRTSEVMATARRREVELEKQGYWF
jgi:hypothetical protein